MKFFGAHIDGVPPLANAPETAYLLGASAYSFCPIDARKWTDKPYSESDVEAFRNLNAGHGFSAQQILPHASLLLNMCSPDARKLNLSRISLIDQMKRCRQLGLDRINFHPGATLKEMSEDDAIKRVAESINYVLEKTEGVTAVIENTAGQGSNIGYTFAQIAAMIAGVEDKSRVGVCIDTCHANAAGYEMGTEEQYESIWHEFDQTIGFDYLKGMHINDAMRPTGSRIDRHASLGKGTIGADFFALIAADKRLDGIPMILETPDPSLWHIEIDWLKAHENK